MRKTPAFSSLLCVLIIFIIIVCAMPARGADNIYGRNGEVFVMIGSGPFKGVYASQKINATGDRVTIPGGRFLFGAKDEYYSIAIDQFRNIYVLSAFADPNPIPPGPGTYYPIDPPAGEGVVGIGADADGNSFYDIINFCPGRMYTLHGKFNAGFFERLANKPFYYDGPADDFDGGTLAGAPNKPPANILNDYITKYSGAAVAGNLTDPPATHVQKVTLTFPNGSILKDEIPANIEVGGWNSHWGTYSATPMNKSTVIKENQVRRIGKQTRKIDNDGDGDMRDESTDTDNDGHIDKTTSVTGFSDCWYPGMFTRWYYHGALQEVNTWGTSNGGLNLQGAGNFQRRYNFKKQYIKLWVTQWVEDIPGGLNLNGAVLPPLKQETDVEVAFNTTNISYKADFGSGCGEDHADTQLGVSTIISSDPKLSLSTTGAGRRYTYASMPVPTAKKGLINFIKDGTGTIKYGIPMGGSTGYTGQMGGGLPLTVDTLSIGAATKDANEDWVYAAPLSEDGMTVIDFCVADQWDGKGGVLYRLLRSNATGKKKLKWNKYDGYNPINAGGITSGSMDMADDVKGIASDGRGSVYYVTDARPVIDNASTPLGTYDALDPSKPVNKPVASVEDGKPIWKWLKEYKVRSATELFLCDYYTKQVTKLNDFTVGSETIRILEVFDDAAGANLKYRGAPVTIGPATRNIKIDLATINLAGPPTGNDERNVVDIVSGNSTLLPQETFSTLGTLADNIPQNQIDQISEDTQYKATMENAPPEFTGDIVNINKRSGTWLKTHDANNNGIFGGFLYSIRPGTATYFWKVEMIQPMKKVLSTQIEFPTTLVNTPPLGWPPPNPGLKSAAVNWAEWRMSKSAAGEGSVEASPEFKFTPKEPGIYKISMMASVKRYKYEDMPYPSYLPQRDDPLYKPSTPEFLFFDNGANGGTAGDGSRNGGEDYIAERYLYVTAKSPVSDGYVSNITITGDSVVDENKVGMWTAKANFRYIKSFRHEDAAAKMETYNGIGCVDYPNNALTEWGLPPYDGVGEDYVKGLPARSSNSLKTAATPFVFNTEQRNFGEKPPGAVLITDPGALAGIDHGGAPVWGTNPKQPLWIEGAGTQSNPSIDLNRADRGAVWYYWYLAAENVEKNGNDRFLGWKTNTREPAILIAQGSLADEKPFPGDNSKTAVKWSGYKNQARKFDVEVNLRYAFDMPLDPGRYFLYVKFEYVKAKWQGRAPKKDAAGNIMKDADGNTLYSFYDMMHDGLGETARTDYNVTGDINNMNGEPFGFKIVVRDKQSPQAFFVGNNPARPNPDYEVALPNGAIPAAGVPFKGATTGDPYPSPVNYIVCDNNPNMKLESNVKIKTGRNSAEFSRAGGAPFKEYPTDEREDVQLSFTEDAVKLALLRTIAPAPDKTPAGTVQDVVEIPLNEYPGYGRYPFRRGTYQLPAMKVTKDDVPYDLVGQMPMYAAGRDESGNVVSNASCDVKAGGVTTEELQLQRTDGAGDARHQEYANAPAYIEVQDNDSPTLIFKSLRPRDNVYREYYMMNSALTAAQEYDPGNDPSYHDELDWDTAMPGKLRVTRYGPGTTTVKDINLGGAETAVDCSGVTVKHFDKYNVAGNDIAIANVGGQPVFTIAFNSRNIIASQAYYDFRPANMAYYDMDSVSTLEIIEDSRSKFELALRDNVDGNVVPTIYKFPAGGVTANTKMDPANLFVDTQNLADEETLAEVMNGWGQEGSWLRTYGVFRNPTPPGNPKPYMFFLVKDSSGNMTAAKVPAAILHTLLKKNVLNVETKRSQ